MPKIAITPLPMTVEYLYQKLIFRDKSIYHRLREDHPSLYLPHWLKLLADHKILGGNDNVEDWYDYLFIHPEGCRPIEVNLAWYRSAPGLSGIKTEVFFTGHRNNPFLNVIRACAKEHNIAYHTIPCAGPESILRRVTHLVDYAPRELASKRISPFPTICR